MSDEDAGRWTCEDQKMMKIDVEVELPEFSGSVVQGGTPKGSSTVFPSHNRSPDIALLPPFFRAFVWGLQGLGSFFLCLDRIRYPPESSYQQLCQQRVNGLISGAHISASILVDISYKL